MVKASVMNRSYALKLTPKLTYKKEARRDNGEPDVITVWAGFEHVNLMPLLDSFLCASYVCTVMPYCAYGSLEQFVLDDQCRLSENQLRIVSKQMMAASLYLKAKGYSHGNLQLSHYIILPEERLLLTDFQCVTNLTTQRVPQFPMGVSMAPELNSNDAYDTELLDVFDMGICLMILCGKVVHNINLQLDLTIPWNSKQHSEEWSQLNPHVRQMLAGMLCLDVSTRFNFQDVRNSKWYQNRLGVGQRRRRIPSNNSRLHPYWCHMTVNMDST